MTGSTSDPALTACKRISQGTHDDPFAVLGPHAHDGTTARVTAFDPGATSSAAVIARDGVIRWRRSPGAPGRLSVGAVRRTEPYRPARRRRRRATAGTCEDPYRFGPVLGEIDEYLLGEGTHQRLWHVLGAHVMHARGRPGHAFRGLGAECAARFGRRRLQPLGRPAPCRCAAAARPASGRSSCPASARARSTNTRSSARTAQLLPLKADPVGFGSQHPPENASVVRDITRLRLARRRWMTSARRQQQPRPRRSRSTRCTSALAAQGRANRRMSYMEAAEELVAYVARHGLHPYRADADQRISLRRLLGLSAGGPVRAHHPPRAAARIPRPGRRRPQGRASACCSTGCRGISRPTRTGSASSTAPRSTNMPTRARGSIRTGTR